MNQISRLLIIFFTLIFQIYAENDKPKTGKFILGDIKETSPIDLNEFANRIGWRPEDRTAYYVLSKKTYNVYVPDNYDPNKAYGLIIFFNDTHDIPDEKIFDDYLQIFKKHNIIALSTDGELLHARKAVQIALDARHAIIKRYNIDKNRIYLFFAKAK